MAVEVLPGPHGSQQAKKLAYISESSGTIKASGSIGAGAQGLDGRQ
jgi:hypothetical protein